MGLGLGWQTPTTQLGFSAVQRVPHLPQFQGSFSTRVHWPPHSTSAPEAAGLGEEAKQQGWAAGRDGASGCGRQLRHRHGQMLRGP